MIKWLHHLLSPHCIECRDESVCRSCETLERQLEIERQRSNLLLEKLAGTRVQSAPVVSDDSDGELKPISTTKRKYLPFAVRQQMMDQNDQKTLTLLQDRWKEAHAAPEKTEVMQNNEKLESELLETDVLAQVK